jgi:hypothetical protein
MTLPLHTTAEDVDAIVGYLKTKATGATHDDADEANEGGFQIQGWRITARLRFASLAQTTTVAWTKQLRH